MPPIFLGQFCFPFGTCTPFLGCINQTTERCAQWDIDGTGWSKVWRRPENLSHFFFVGPRQDNLPSVTQSNCPMNVCGHFNSSVCPHVCVCECVMQIQKYTKKMLVCACACVCVLPIYRGSAYYRP